MVIVVQKRVCNHIFITIHSFPTLLMFDRILNDDYKTKSGAQSGTCFCFVVDIF